MATVLVRKRCVAVLLGGAALSLTAAASAQRSESCIRQTEGQYRYCYQPTLEGRAVLELDSARVVHGHAAVWYGVSAGRRWLQAGIDDEGDGPFLYIETHAGLRRVGPIAYGRRVTVELACNGRADVCAVTLAGSTRRAYLPGARDCILAAETYGNAALSGRANTAPIRVG